MTEDEVNTGESSIFEEDKKVPKPCPPCAKPSIFARDTPHSKNHIFSPRPLFSLGPRGMESQLDGAITQFFFSFSPRSGAPATAHLALGTHNACDLNGDLYWHGDSDPKSSK